MTPLDTYTTAVAQRKAITRRGKTPCINFSVISQLEDKDIPLLLEIIREQSTTIDECFERADTEDGVQLTGEDAIAMSHRITACKVRVNQLALSGDATRWGDVRVN